MEYFKYEMHLHTAEVSPCARVPAKDIPKLYQDKGYDVLVVTDHYYPGFFEARMNQKWQDSIDAYLQGYYALANEGLKCGMRVLLGMEITFTENKNDYLVYGINENFLKSHPQLYKKNLKHLYNLARKNKLFVAQAHPFREYIKIAKADLLNGVEVCNGNMRHNSHNDLALEFAEKNNLIQIAGSDFHQVEDAAQAATLLSGLADTSEELADILFADKSIKIIGGNA